MVLGVSRFDVACVHRHINGYVICYPIVQYFMLKCSGGQK